MGNRDKFLCHFPDKLTVICRPGNKVESHKLNWKHAEMQSGPPFWYTYISVINLNESGNTYRQKHKITDFGPNFGIRVCYYSAK